MTKESSMSPTVNDVPEKAHSFMGVCYMGVYNKLLYPLNKSLYFGDHVLLGLGFLVAHLQLP